MQQHGAAQDAHRRCRRSHLAPRLDRISPHKAWAEASCVGLHLPPLQRAEAAGAAYGGSGAVCRAGNHFAFVACGRGCLECTSGYMVFCQQSVRVHGIMCMQRTYQSNFLILSDRTGLLYLNGSLFATRLRALDSLNHSKYPLSRETRSHARSR